EDAHRQVGYHLDLVVERTEPRVADPVVSVLPLRELAVVQRRGERVRTVEQERDVGEVRLVRIEHAVEDRALPLAEHGRARGHDEGDAGGAEWVCGPVRRTVASGVQAGIDGTGGCVQATPEASRSPSGPRPRSLAASSGSSS